MRIISVEGFLYQNEYIFEKYYDREKYPEFWEEDIYNYDFENLDIKRVSFMIIGIFNNERISEGLINDMVLNGTMLKLVERAKVLKEDK